MSPMITPAHRGLLLAATLALGICHIPSGAQARQCGDFDGMGRFVGGMISLGTIGLTAFVAPAIAKGANNNLRYWPGVGWTALGATLGGAAGFSLTFTSECDPFTTSMVLPGVMAVSVGTVAAVLYGVFNRGAPLREKKNILTNPDLQVVFSPVDQGGMGGVVGRF